MSEVFHVGGVVFVSHIIMKRWRRDRLNESGIMRMSSLGTPSGPGDLPLRSEASVALKVCSLKT